MFTNNKIKASLHLLIASCTRLLSLVLLVTCLQLATINTAQAQCPMCKMSAESNLKNGGTAGQGLNQGILYMLLTPYLLIGTIGYVWYRNRRKEEDIIMEEQDY